ncbi:hypothetical protein TIFTF001_047319 [Ficus carica]|uniref:Uncharacterized protein n=1 Tax=Ficus carica TaxID=3494 RepID=A0AA87YTM9_FICCA|nr:hypothetical protein TIFTF001_047319 [Ficus carica]
MELREIVSHASPKLFPTQLATSRTAACVISDGAYMFTTMATVTDDHEPLLAEEISGRLEWSSSPEKNSDPDGSIRKGLGGGQG